MLVSHEVGEILALLLKQQYPEKQRRKGISTVEKLKTRWVYNTGRSEDTVLMKYLSPLALQ